MEGKHFESIKFLNLFVGLTIDNRQIMSTKVLVFVVCHGY